MIRVTIFNEFIDEKKRENVKSVYPEGIHIALKNVLQDDFTITTITMDDENCGVTDELLNNTDVMLWWGHVAQHKVPDEVVNKIQDAVLKGMGFIALHSAVHSKPFRRLVGSSCSLTWREDDDYEFLWVCNPAHPIAEGIDRCIKIDHEEAYGEPFLIPEPDELVFIAYYERGEAFRAGCCFRRGAGKIFFFQPGHEEFPTFKDPNVIKIIKNAIRWAAPQKRLESLLSPNVKKPIEEFM